MTFVHKRWFFWFLKNKPSCKHVFISILSSQSIHAGLSNTLCEAALTARKPVPTTRSLDLKACASLSPVAYAMKGESDSTMTALESAYFHNNVVSTNASLNTVLQNYYILIILQYWNITKSWTPQLIHTCNRAPVIDPVIDSLPVNSVPFCYITLI